jgi:poly(hydroxyalkanoate) granule-associated protein
MATKPPQPAASAAPSEDDPNTAPTSPSNVWLAGLGALAKAQAEGSKAFEALVQQGVAMQNKTQALAKERMEAMAQQATGGPASWNRLGGIFEDRVAQALHSLGMPSSQELAALTARVEALEKQLNTTGQAAKPAEVPSSPSRTRKKSPPRA